MASGAVEGPRRRGRWKGTMTAHSQGKGAAEGAELYPASRLAAAAAAAGQAGLSALLLTPGPDLRYLSGYDALATERLTCLAVPAEGPAFLLAPRLEQGSVHASPVARMGVEILAWDETDDPFRMVGDRLRGMASVGLADQMWAMMVLRFRAVLPGARQALASDALRGLRVRKSPAEIAALREAGAAIDRVHQQVPGWLRPGRSEREVAADIGGTMPSGYCSDCTRTYAIGPPPAEFASYYQVLQDAQEAACAAVRPGEAAESVDAVARSHITGAGYGDFFLHRTGHGIGLETHEHPYIVSGNTERLEPGMAFSVEPGIYPGPHGARIEDIVACTPDGAERLNNVTRDLVVVGA